MVPGIRVLSQWQGFAQCVGHQRLHVTREENAVVDLAGSQPGRHLRALLAPGVA